MGISNGDHQLVWHVVGYGKEGRETYLKAAKASKTTSQQHGAQLLPQTLFPHAFLPEVSSGAVLYQKWTGTLSSPDN